MYFVNVLVLCHVLYCYGNNVGLSQGDHINAVAVLLR